MKVFTLSVDATFSFDVEADSPEAALAQARGLLQRYTPVNDYGTFYEGFLAPWVSPAHADEDYRTLEVVDECDSLL